MLYTQLIISKVLLIYPLFRTVVGNFEKLLSNA